MDWNRRIIETSAGGVWVVDLDGLTVDANQAAASLLGVSLVDLRAGRIDDYLDAQGREQFARHLTDVRAGSADAAQVDCLFHRPDGSSCWAIVREALLLDEDGQVVGLLLNVDDITARTQLLLDLQRSEQQRADAEQAARLGTWQWQAGEVTYSDGMTTLYGARAPVILSSHEAFIEAVHPDDRSRAVTTFEHVMSDGIGEVEARVLAESGYIWIYARVVASLGADGRPVLVRGTHLDVTQVRDTDGALRDLVKQNTFMQAVASAANEASTLVDVLAGARHLVLLHDDWDRASGFVPTLDGLHLDRIVVDDPEGWDDDGPTAQRERRTALRCLRELRAVWDDEERLTLAFPVLLDDVVVAVLVVTSLPPLYRHEMIEQMAGLVAGQLTRVAERERTARELAEARDRALEASQHKSTFLSTMSHEIRTPLNGVIGLTELLARTELDDRQHDLIAGLDLSGRALLAVINDILDFSKIEAGRLDLESVDVDVRTVLDQVSGVLAESARARDLDLAVSCAADVPGVLTGDPTRLAQVVTNLVSNAVKFTTRGRIELRARRQPRTDGPDMLVIEVEDTGVGVPADRVGTIFQAFSQADLSTTRRFGGTGLGLAICREIVDAMGGEMGLESTLGLGSTFWFSVPILEPTATSPGGPGPRPTAMVPVAPALAAPAPAAAVSPYRVLVVEDNAVNQMVALGLLEVFGHRADTAENGDQALTMTARTAYDLVLMDVQMPVLDGYACTRLLRERERRLGLPRAAVVAMTAAAVAGERERALASGMDDFMTKPVTGAAVGAVLQRWLVPATGPASDHHDPSAATPGAATGPTGLDPQRLAELIELLPGGDYLRRVVDSFLERGPDMLDAVRRAAAAPDDLAAAAHTLAGSAANLGVLGVGDTARELELAAREGVSTDGAVLDRLTEQMQDAVRNLQDYRLTLG